MLVVSAQVIFLIYFLAGAGEALEAAAERSILGKTLESKEEETIPEE